MTVLGYITCKNEEEAHTIAKALLEKKLIACANIIPTIHSFYWWEGKIVEEEPESLLLVKTRKEKEDEVMGAVKAVHSYSLPCIEFIAIENENEEYKKWVEGVVQ